MASFFGALIGAGCVLVAVYVTNMQTLVIENQTVDSAVSVLHTRINDFYIFAGIVITLLLAINVGVFIRAEDEVDKHIKENFDSYKKRIEIIHVQCLALLRDLQRKTNISKKRKNEN
ncbi:MAG TPA: hypothetical protein VFE50_08965 [Cyclobacteriaceae bacterium]|nr:hypothetical protein [Cyclobacteriaceae bacterium]